MSVTLACRFVEYEGGRDQGRSRGVANDIHAVMSVHLCVVVSKLYMLRASNMMTMMDG